MLNAHDRHVRQICKSAPLSVLGNEERCREAPVNLQVAGFPCNDGTIEVPRFQAFDCTFAMSTKASARHRSRTLTAIALCVALEGRIANEAFVLLSADDAVVDCRAQNTAL